MPSPLNFLIFNCVVLHNNTVTPVLSYYCSILSSLFPVLCPPVTHKFPLFSPCLLLCIFMQYFCIFMQCKTLVFTGLMTVTTKKRHFIYKRKAIIFFLGLLSHISHISWGYSPVYPQYLVYSLLHTTMLLFRPNILCLFLLLPLYLVSFPFSPFSVLSLCSKHCFTHLSFFSFQNYAILLHCHTILSIIINSVYPLPLLS